jgi:hypothetical protein
MEPTPEEEQNTESYSTSVERHPVEVITRTDEVNVHIKYIYQVVVTTYADGSTQQTRHKQSDTRITVDR